MTMTDTILMDPDNIADFVVHYTRAVRHNEEQFTWQGHELLTDYAGYMLCWATENLAKQLRADD